MFYYDSNKNLVKIPLTEKISHRYNSHFVFKTASGKVLKSFRTNAGYIPDLALEQQIQFLNLPNFYKIENYFFNKSGDFKAFLMPFYESDPNDILLKHSDYLADNFNAIFTTFETLAEEGIETRDANLENTIFTANEIIIIDSERYDKHPTEEIEEVKASNYSSAAWILYFTIINAAKQHEEFANTNFYKYFYDTRPDGKILCQSIAQHNQPIDFLQKVKKKIL